MAKILIEKSIYPTEEQIKSEVDNYVRANYKDNLRKFTTAQWNSYYMKNFHGPVKLFYLIYMFFLIFEYIRNI